MEDFIGIIVLVLIVLVSASGKKKKAEKPARQRKQAEKPRETGFEQAFARKQSEALKQQVERKATGEVRREADCDRRPLHLHEVSQQQMNAAGEGEDPCHAGYHALQEEPSPVYEPDAALADPRGQELVRGVIMSEILKRPCERMAERHDRRRASW